MTDTGHPPFQFGISGLDNLIWSGAKPIGNHPPFTACIVGPDGCGKSLVALHLASQYFSDHSDDGAKVVYVSTDLSYQQAEGQWKSFGLNKPKTRAQTLSRAYSGEGDPLTNEGEVKLCRIGPSSGGSDEYERMLFESMNEVAFVNMHSETAGDDWTYINHLIGLLENPRTDTPHLLIIDAVEGLEILVGERDRFGNFRSRRSRIAQIVRNAYRKNVHVLFIIEEPELDARLPEQFVTDLVIRLRASHVGSYTQRTIEVEKCRGFAHARGEHEFTIRSGNGTLVGQDRFHLDDPRITWGKGRLAHLHVIESIHRWNRRLCGEPSTVPHSKGRPTFGLRHLEELLPGKQEESSDGGSVTMLLGEASTYKNRLSRAFLSQAFNKDTKKSGAAILVSTTPMDSATLTMRMRAHLPDDFPERQLKDRVFCRHLPAQHLASANLLRIVETYIHNAQAMLCPNGKIPRTIASIQRMSADDRCDISKGRRIHLVINDWNLICQMHPNIAEDPLILQSLLTLCKREGIHALFVSTQPAQPNLPVRLGSVTDLRVLSEPQILTWNIPFFGERRTAITVVSSLTNNRSPSIYELRSAIQQPVIAEHERLYVDPHFSHYANVDQGRPERIPLVVRCYSGNHPVNASDTSGPHAAQMIEQSLAQIFPAAPPHDKVTVFETFASYDKMLSSASLLNETRLDHTLVFQVDEFWTGQSGAWEKLDSYLNEEVGTAAFSSTRKEFKIEQLQGGALK